MKLLVKIKQVVKLQPPIKHIILVVLIHIILVAKLLIPVIHITLMVVIHTILKELGRIKLKVIRRIRLRGPQLQSLIRHIRLVVIHIVPIVPLVLIVLAIIRIIPVRLAIRRIILIILVIIRTRPIRPLIEVNGQFIFQQPNILLSLKLFLMGCIRRICLRILEVRIRFNIQQRSNLLLFFLLERIQFLKKFKKYKYL